MDQLKTGHQKANVIVLQMCIFAKILDTEDSDLKGIMS